MKGFLKTVCWKYSEFNGRASRKEFWGFLMWKLIIGMALIFSFFLLMLAGGASPAKIEYISHIFTNSYLMLLLMPTLAVSVRRLHDTGRSGWWYLCVPIFLVFALQDSQPHANKYGANPKGVGNNFHMHNLKKPSFLKDCLMPIGIFSVFILLMGAADSKIAVNNSLSLNKTNSFDAINYIKTLETEYAYEVALNLLDILSDYENIRFKNVRVVDENPDILVVCGEVNVRNINDDINGNNLKFIGAGNVVEIEGTSDFAIYWETFCSGKDGNLVKLDGLYTDIIDKSTHI